MHFPASVASGITQLKNLYPLELPVLLLSPTAPSLFTKSVLHIGPYAEVIIATHFTAPLATNVQFTIAYG